MPTRISVDKREEKKCTCTQVSRSGKWVPQVNPRCPSHGARGHLQIVK